MRSMFSWVLLAALLSAPAFAGDKDKPKVVTASKEEKVKEKVKKGGNKFVRFWTDDVGDTIYHGLKKGSNKIANAFD